MDPIEKDLRTYLAKLGSRGELLTVEAEVSPRTEAAALIDAAIKRGRPLMLARSTGNPMRMIGNSFGSRSAIETALGCTETGIMAWFGERASKAIPVVLVDKAPVQEVIADAVDLDRLPIPLLHQEDAGPYITAGIGITKDPESGRQNAGYYSLQLKGKDRLALRMLPSTQGYEIFQKRLKRGLRTEMAVAIGLHPIEMIAASAHTPFDEFELAGALRGEPLEMVRCQTLDLAVPAHAEIVLEGVILPDVKEPEGPIGDWLGYYPLVEDRHIFKVERMTHRRDPIFQTILSGTAEENLLLAIPRGAAALGAARKAASGIRNLTLDPFLPCCVLQIAKTFEGEPMNALLAAMGEVPFVKIGIAVDPDVDLHNMNDVMWAMVTRTRLENDVNIIRNVMGFSRDPFQLYKAKMAIDATVPLDLRDKFKRSKITNAPIDLEKYLQKAT
ncbi:MAG: UbiD family decarboxylase [Rhodospirillales bacterium]|nr:UbiD family decarboxylase [Rhodospirillales bacterium]